MKFIFSDSKERQRPRVTNFKSGAKAAGLTLWNGWKDGVTGIVTRPQTGYRRHGQLGAAAGTLIGIVNLGMKPAVGTFASLTWFSRGIYVSVRKRVQTYRNKRRRIPTKLFDTTSTTTSNGQFQNDDDNEEVSSAAKMAATRSGLHPKVCQRILQEFEKIKNERESKKTLMKRLKSLRDFFSSRK
jgi:hypothetical protein